MIIKFNDGFFIPSNIYAKRNGSNFLTDELKNYFAEDLGKIDLRAIHQQLQVAKSSYGCFYNDLKLTTYIKSYFDTDNYITHHVCAILGEFDDEAMLVNIADGNLYALPPRNLYNGNEATRYSVVDTLFQNSYNTNSKSITASFNSLLVRKSVNEFILFHRGRVVFSYNYKTREMKMGEPLYEADISKDDLQRVNIMLIAFYNKVKCMLLPVDGKYELIAV